MRAIVKPYLGGLHAHEGSCADAMDEASRKRPLEEEHSSAASTLGEESRQRLVALFGLKPNSKVLLVGEGNLSFASALAALKTGAQVTATTYETEEEHRQRFAGSSERCEALRDVGMAVAHAVDATNLAATLPTDIPRPFDRIIFQFPQHPSRSKIQLHRELLGCFLKAAEGILAEAGEVIVSLLRGQGGTAAETEQRRPKDTWQAVELGLEAGLLLRHVSSCPMKDLADLGYTTTGFRGQGLRDATAQVFQERAFNSDGSLTHCFCRPGFFAHQQYEGGKKIGIIVPTDATVDDLRATAEMEMRRSLGKLISACGTVLLASSTLVQEGIKDGDVIIAVVQDVTVAAATSAFAVIRSDGTVVAWGNPHFGGDCSAVQEQLQHVQSIQAALGAFAALRADGSVVTWGDPGGGGDSSSVQSQLCNVCQVQSSGLAFAAIKADGSVVTWGSPSYGGDCSAVRDQLYSVQQIQSNYVAFAALRADGNVVTWGETDSSAVRDELQEGVLSIYAQDFMGFMGFAAIKAGGRLVFWGGGLFAPRGLIHSGLDNIAHLQVVGRRWAAASEDGNLALSFESIRGEGCLLVPECASSLARCRDCLAVLQKDGTVQFWGRCAPTWLRKELSNVVRLRMAGVHGAALRSDGSVVLWENTARGSNPGASALVRSQLTDVKDIQANSCAFAFLRRDGSVVTWGEDRYGGNSAAVQTHLTDVVSIQASHLAFAAIRRDGSVVTWGEPGSGGDSSLVQEQLGRRVANKQAALRAKQAGPSVQASLPIERQYDISFWIGPDFCDASLTAAAAESFSGLVAKTHLLDAYTSPRDGREARTYRISISTTSRIVTQADWKAMCEKMRKKLMQDSQIEPRRVAKEPAENSIQPLLPWLTL
eukprot:s736_g2.t3